MKSHSWLIRFSNWLLSKIYDEHLYDEIEGDMHELHNERLTSMGSTRASLLYLWDAVLSVRNIGLRKKREWETDRFGMILNYFRMAFRHLRKDKIFSSISIFGLSISIAICFLIFQYAFFELDYDKYAKNSKDIYRLTTHTYENDQLIYPSALSGVLMADAVKEKISEVTSTTRMVSTKGWFDCTLKYTLNDNVKIFNERHLYYVDSNFLDMFNYSMLYGSKSTALEKPYSIVLTATAAKRYFGNDEAIGKVLHLKGSRDENDYTVTGILVDPPINSHLDGDIFLSMSSVSSNPYFNTIDAYTYIQIMPFSNYEALQSKISNLSSELIPVNGKTKTVLGVQRLSDIHLHSFLQDEMKQGGNAKATYFLLLIACVILIIAWINYVNLSTSRTIVRAKEVGIRKVSGASRNQLFYQFTTEAIVINLISVFIGILIIQFIGPYFYRFIGLPTYYAQAFRQFNIFTIYLLFAAFVLGVFLSGFYPARILASYNPAMVLKGKGIGGEGVVLRKVLVVFQFTCAIGLMIAVIGFQQQFKHIQNQDLGVDISKTMIVKAPANVDSTYRLRLQSFKAQLESYDIVKSITSSSSVPGEKIEWTGSVRKEKQKSAQHHQVTINVVDPDFINSYHLSLLAGRNFIPSDFPINQQFGTKIEPVILNKTAISQMQYGNPEDAIGSTLYWNNIECRVVGVIDDFHQQSLKNVLESTLFTANTGPVLSFKLGVGFDDGNMTKSIATIHSAWDAFFPDNAFDYFFLDDFYENQYSNDQQVMNAFQLFCWLALVISCLGLLGISSFTAKQRTREIGIRKVLGASSVNLITLLSKEFFLLLIVSTCFALPLSYFGISEWLQSFAYHTELTAWIFIFPVIVIFSIAFLTIYTQTFSVIKTNPSETLKND